MSSFSASVSDEKLLQATAEHRFIRAVSNGEITSEQFSTWLAQDYLFVVKYVRFTAHALVNAPRKDYQVLIDGLSTLGDELAWFERKLNERNIVPKDIQALPANLNYQQWLNDLIQTKKSYLTLLTVFYAIELCYYQAWKSVDNADYKEFANRWASKEFGQYLDQLREAVDAASTMASEDDRKEARQFWDVVMLFEIDFWNMAFHART